MLEEVFKYVDKYQILIYKVDIIKQVVRLKGELPR